MRARPVSGLVSGFFTRERHRRERKGTGERAGRNGERKMGRVGHETEVNEARSTDDLKPKPPTLLRDFVVSDYIVVAGMQVADVELSMYQHSQKNVMFLRLKPYKRKKKRSPPFNDPRFANGGVRFSFWPHATYYGTL